MNKSFKTLLLKIAALPLKDQKWVLSQLSPKQQQQFAQWQGNSLLSKARKFRYLSCPQIPEITQLPALCQDLATQPPLYIALILEQGEFIWEASFLQSHAQEEQIRQLKQEAICLMKPATKKALFKQWRSQLNFTDQLEGHHG